MRKKLAVCLLALAVLFGGCAPRQQPAPAPSSQPEEASPAGSDAGEESFTVTWNGSFYTCAGYTEELCPEPVLLATAEAYDRFCEENISHFSTDFTRLSVKGESPFEAVYRDGGCVAAIALPDPGEGREYRLSGSFQRAAVTGGCLTVEVQSVPGASDASRGARWLFFTVTGDRLPEKAAVETELLYVRPIQWGPRYYPVTGGGVLPEEALVFTDAAAFGDFLAEYGGRFGGDFAEWLDNFRLAPGEELHLQDWFFDAGGELVVVALPALPEGSRCAVTDAWTDTDTHLTLTEVSGLPEAAGEPEWAVIELWREEAVGGLVLDRETVRAPSYGPAAEALLAALGDGREWYPETDDPMAPYLALSRTGEGLLAVNGYGVVTAVREEAPGVFIVEVYCPRLAPPAITGPVGRQEAGSYTLTIDTTPAGGSLLVASTDPVRHLSGVYRPAE